MAKGKSISIVEMVIEELQEERKPIPTEPAEQVVVLEGPRITVNR